MLAFDDLGSAVVLPDAFDQFIVRLTITFRDKNVGGPFQVSWRFTEGSAGKQSFRSKWLPPIHKDPFDRLLVAQAMAEPLHLLTHDTALAPYSADLVILV